MTVWVDDARIPKRHRGVELRWSHLTASTPGELHVLAKGIGLQVRWFQPRCKSSDSCPVIDGVCPHFHYDVVDSMRDRALSAGVTPIGLRDMGAITSARRKQFRSLLGTRPTVLTGIKQGLADPTMDPTVIDWAPRQAAALIPFEVIDGRPVNPVQPELPYGRNDLWHWAEQVAADMAVFVHVGGRRYLLMADRRDKHGCGFPGGGVNLGEDPIDAAFRECGEETGLHLSRDVVADMMTVLPARYVPDPRAGREAWMVTVPVVVDLGELAELPPVEGDDDIQKAVWVPADGFLQLRMELAANGLTMFPAHEGMLEQIVGRGWRRKQVRG